MTGEAWGWIGGIGGAVIGALGGAVGTYASIRNASPGPARRFMIRVAVWTWLMLVLFTALVVLAATGTLPRWVIWASQGVLFAALGPAILLINRRLRRLEAETMQVPPTP